MTKAELLKILDELWTGTGPPRHSAPGMLSSSSIRRIRLSGPDIRMALELTIEIVQSIPADRIERAFQSIEDRPPE